MSSNSKLGSRKIYNKMIRVGLIWNPSSPKPSLVHLTGHLLEFFWLLAVILIPIAFFDRESFIGEAAISNFEVPKVAFLRIITGLIVVVWLIECWAKYPQLSFITVAFQRLKVSPRASIILTKDYLRDQPGSAIILAVLIFGMSTVFSTLCSSSFKVSLWGEVPGQDGYSAYTMSAYFILFAAIATHLRNRQQLYRLLGAIVITGIMLSGYSIFQHYQFDFLNLSSEIQGGNKAVTAFQGNNLFAGAVMLMPIPVSIALAFISLRGFGIWSCSEPKNPLKLSKPGLILGFWGLIIAIQSLGLLFSFSRGPWVGCLCSVVGLFGLGSIVFGVRTVARLLLLLLVVVSFIAALLYWKGSISFLGFPNWIGILIAVVGLIGTTGIFITWYKLLWFYLISGVAGIILFSGVTVLVLSDNSEESSFNSSNSESVLLQAGDRFTSIGAAITTGGLSGRYRHWLVSWEIIRDRPWTTLEDLTLKWIRPIVGYGPELFRYVYLLESPPSPPLYLPHEPDHAHNFLIHQTLELGLLGFLSTLALFLSIFWVILQIIVRSALPRSGIDTLIILGVSTALVGKSVEMMVGVARISDLTLFWVLLACLTVLSMAHYGDNRRVENQADPNTVRSSGRRQDRRRIKSKIHDRKIIRVAVFVGLVPVFLWIVVMVWITNVNYLNAGRNVADAIHQYYGGNFQESLNLLNHATDLAPDVPVYYNYKAGVYSEFLKRNDVSKEIGCLGRVGGYESCLVEESLNNNLNAMVQRPLSYKTHLALGEFYQEHNDYKNAAFYYSQGLELIPNSWVIRDELARMHLNLGNADQSVDLIDESLALRSGIDAPESWFLKGRAYDQLGKFEMAAQSLESSLVQGLGKDLSDQSYNMLHRIYAVLGFSRGTDGYLNIINGTPDINIRAKHDYGRFLNNMGRHAEALEIFDELLSKRGDFEYLHFDHPQYAADVEASRADVYSDVNFNFQAVAGYKKALVSLPDDAEFWLELGKLQIQVGDHEEGMKALKHAAELGLGSESQISQRMVLDLQAQTTSQAYKSAVELYNANQFELAAGYLEYQIMRGLPESAIDDVSSLLVEIYNYLEPSRVIHGYIKIIDNMPFKEKFSEYLYKLNSPELAAEYIEKAIILGLPSEAEHGAFDVLSQVYQLLTQSRAIEGYKKLAPVLGYDHRIAQGYLKFGHMEQAADYLESSLISNLDTLDEINHAFAVLGEAYERLSISRAIQGYDRIIENQPSPSAYDGGIPGQPERPFIPRYKKAEYLNKIGRHAEALEIFESLLQINFDHPDKRNAILLNRAHTLKHMGMFESAIRDYEVVLDYIHWSKDPDGAKYRIEKPIYPNLRDIWISLAECQVTLGDHISAQLAINTSINYEGEEQYQPLNRKLLKLKERGVSEAYLIAERYYQSGQSLEAANFLEHRITNGLSYWAINQAIGLLLEVYSDLDVIRIIQGYNNIKSYISYTEDLLGYLQDITEPTLAAEYLEKELILAWSDIELAAYFQDMDKPELAAEYIEKAIILDLPREDGDKVFDLLYEAYQLLTQSRVIEGYKKLAPVLGYDHRIAQGYLKFGHMEQAADYLESSLISNLDTLDEINHAFAMLGEAYERLSISRAIQGYDRIIENQPSPSAYDGGIPGQPERPFIPRYKKAEYLNKIGRHAEALEIFESLLQINFDHPDKRNAILLNRAHTLKHMGMFESAIRDYEVVLDLIHWRKGTDGAKYRIEKPIYPNLRDIWISLAECQAKLGHYVGSEEALSMASQVDSWK